MGVDHAITVGYGFTLTQEQVDDLWYRQHPDDPDGDYYDGAYEVVETEMERWPDLTHFAAGSYYDSDPEIGYAIILRDTKSSAEDLAGFLDVKRPFVTASVDRQFWEAWTLFTDYETKPPLRWLVGGLWH